MVQNSFKYFLKHPQIIKKLLTTFAHNKVKLKLKIVLNSPKFRQDQCTLPAIALFIILSLNGLKTQIIGHHTWELELPLLERSAVSRED